MSNQSAENADVAFVKGANERNEFFEREREREKKKKKKQYHISNKSGRTRQRTNNPKDEMIWEMNSLTRQRLEYHCANRTI